MNNDHLQKAKTPFTFSLLLEILSIKGMSRISDIGSNTHGERVWVTAGNANQSPRGTRLYPIPSPQNTCRLAVKKYEEQILELKHCARYASRWRTSTTRLLLFVLEGWCFPQTTDTKKGLNFLESREAFFHRIIEGVFHCVYELYVIKYRCQSCGIQVQSPVHI